MVYLLAYFLPPLDGCLHPCIYPFVVVFFVFCKCLIVSCLTLVFLAVFRGENAFCPPLSIPILLGFNKFNIC